MNIPNQQTYFLNNLCHFLKNSRDVTSFIRNLLTPLIDLFLRFWLFKTFFISAIIKIADWDNALYLARYEYPVDWLNFVTAAYLGVSIELIGSLLLILGLATRVAALPLLALSLVIQYQYQQVDSQLLWIIFFSWYSIMGAGKISLDHALAEGFKNSPLPFSNVICTFYDVVKKNIGPIYVFLLRVFVAFMLNISGHYVVASSLSIQEIIGYHNHVALLEANHLNFVTTIILPSFLILGFATRITLFLLAVMSLLNPQMALMGWLLMLILLLLEGPKALSIDFLIHAQFNRFISKLEARFFKNFDSLPHVVIIGGGFGGVAAAKKLKNTACRITLIDKNNYHLFQPLLYQVATASLSPADIAVPIRELFATQNNIKILMQEVTDIDVEKQQVITNEKAIDFDYLVLATGAKHSYFGKDEWSEFAPGLKTLEDATSIRRKILIAFEKAESSDDPKIKESLLSFVIVGGGPTGVELAGAIAELTHHGMQSEFSNIDLKQIKIYLVQSADRLLPPFHEQLSAFTKKSLEKLGVTVLTNSRVVDINHDGVKIGEKYIAASNTFWAAGVEASPVAKWLKMEGEGRSGHIAVDDNLLVKGQKKIFAIGDVALAHAYNGKPMPGIAPAAKQSGQYVAQYINHLINNKQYHKKFTYIHYGNLATIGRKSAVADFSILKVSGSSAWWLWGIIHVFFLAGMRNRISVSIEWMWSYLTLKRSTRLITKG